MGTKMHRGSKRAALIGEDFSRYVEPFAGSACVFFNLQPEKALLGDINHELMHTYVEVKYRVGAVVQQLLEWPRTSGRRPIGPHEHAKRGRRYRLSLHGYP